MDEARVLSTVTVSDRFVFARLRTRSRKSAVLWDGHLNISRESHCIILCNRQYFTTNLPAFQGSILEQDGCGFVGLS